MRAEALQAKVIQGDCLDIMAGMPDASIDAIVTDPPYGLSFMGKDWDKGVPGEAFWREALRIGKPGCHILAAGGSRTYHRLAVAIEDAGWEIRDCIMWIYGSGFPKSHDVSKAIDREAGADRKKIGDYGQGFRSAGSGLDGWQRQAHAIDKGITAPATAAAKQWQGWGTALKPAYEPFILARKPLDGTVASNVQRHGCGGINVDGCRVGTDELTPRNNKPGPNGWKNSSGGYIEPPPLGRWPANVIHDGSDEVMARFPQVKSIEGGKSGSDPGMWSGKKQIDRKGYSDSGSAARFFYCPKASRSERGEHNHHPTVKPINLMSYLCRLITPPGGLILDPFCGSGSTGVAAMREGFNFTGIELNPEYVEIAKRRISHEHEKAALLA